MVTLSRIYTRTGDGGKTRLGDYSEVAKTDPRVEAYGCTDELNAVLGLALTAPLQPEHRVILERIQNELFDLGADLCRPIGEGEEEGEKLRVQAEQVKRLEEEIDRLNEKLASLKSFVLPGGTAAAAWLHLGRTVCRRAERQIWHLAEKEQLNEQAIVYLNRLSDLLFVLARMENDGGRGDVLWEPGRTREGGSG